MKMRRWIQSFPTVALFLCPLTALLPDLPAQTPPRIDPAHMPELGTVDPRYLSYNVEMVEVTGGRFWRPYASLAQAAKDTPSAPSATQPGDMSALFEYRPPLDLANPRLRRLAAALGPAYIRVSGTWQNSTYFQNNDQPAPAQPPPPIATLSLPGRSS